MGNWSDNLSTIHLGVVGSSQNLSENDLICCYVEQKGNC